MPKNRRAALLAVACVATIGLSGCDPAPGSGFIKLRQAVVGDTDGGTTTCQPPFSVGDNAGPLYRWDGEVGGATTTITIGLLTSSGDLSFADVTVGEQRWYTFDYPLWPDPPISVPIRPNVYKYDLTQREGGVAQLQAVLPPQSGTATEGLLQVDITLRCPEPA